MKMMGVAPAAMYCKSRQKNERRGGIQNGARGSKVPWPTKQQSEGKKLWDDEDRKVIGRALRALTGVALATDGSSMKRLQRELGDGSVLLVLVASSTRICFPTGRRRMSVSLRSMLYVPATLTASLPLLPGASLRSLSRRAFAPILLPCICTPASARLWSFFV